MKPLFICKGNIGRSQMAEALYNQLSPDGGAGSAGLKPPTEWIGRSIAETNHTAAALTEIGIDVRPQTVKQLTEPMVAAADKIIVIGESDNWPDYLRQRTDVVYWEIMDTKSGGTELYRAVREQIREHVLTLIKL